MKKLKLKICMDSGLLAGKHCPIGRIVYQYFIPGTEPTRVCNIKPVSTSPPKAGGVGRTIENNYHVWRESLSKEDE